MLGKIILMLLLIVAILPITNNIAFAENPNKLILEKEFLSPNTYKRNGDPISWGEAKEILRSDPEAAAELDTANKFKVLAVISEIGMTVLLLDRINDYSRHNSSINSASKSTFLTGIISLSLLAIFSQFQSDNHFRKAFDTYNSKLAAKTGLTFKSLYVGKESIGLIFAF